MWKCRLCVSHLVIFIRIFYKPCLKPGNVIIQFTHFIYYFQFMVVFQRDEFKKNETLDILSFPWEKKCVVIIVQKIQATNHIMLIFSFLSIMLHNGLCVEWRDFHWIKYKMVSTIIISWLAHVPSHANYHSLIWPKIVCQQRVIYIWYLMRGVSFYSISTGAMSF